MSDSEIDYDSFCGVGIGMYPNPDEPDNTSSVVSVSPGIGGLFISWTLPLINPWAVSYYKLYRSTENDLMTANYLALTGGDMFFDASSVEVSIVYYYWIRVVSVLGTEGPLLGPGWGQMNPTVDDILLVLKNQIGVDELYPDLKSLLNEISVNSTHINQEIVDRISADQLTVSALELTQGQLEGTGSLLTSEIIDRIDGDNALVSQIDTVLVQSGDNAAAIYTEQTVRADADLALAEAIVALEAENIGQDTGHLANQLAITQLTVRVADNEGDITGNSTSITQLSGSVTNNETGLNTSNLAIDQLEVNLNITDGNVENNAISITDLEAGVVDLADDISGNASALTNVAARVLTNEGDITSQALQITELTSDVSGQGDSLTAQGSAISQLETNSDITDGNVSSNANSIVQLNTDITNQGNNVTANADAITGLTVSVNNNDGEISVISQDVTILNNSVFDETSGLEAANSAISGMSSTITVIEDEIVSHTSDIVLLNTSVENLDTGVDVNAGAISNLGLKVETNEDDISIQGVSIVSLTGAIESTDETVSDNALITEENALVIEQNAGAISGLGIRVEDNEEGLSSQAISITELTASIESTDGTVSANATITQQMGVEVTSQGNDITNLSAQWNIQTNVNGHIAGIGLYNDGSTADFIVSVDTFAIVESNVTNLTDGNPKIPFIVGTVNGVSTIAMDASVFIADATIQTASIGDAVITSALIADASIINAKIGNIIESTNYDPNDKASGWRISKSDGIEASEITIYGIDGETILNSGGVNYSQLVDDNLMKPEDGATKGATWNPESITGLPSDADLLNINTDWSDVAGTENAPDDGANLTTDTSQLNDGAGLGDTASWGGVTGAGKPDDDANNTTNTNQLTDGAGLGNTANWGNVTGAGKPDNNANNTTNTNQLTDGAELGNTASWNGVSGTGKPVDNAQINAPSLGIKINHDSFTNPNMGECYIHGYDSSGDAANTAGYLFLSNNKTSIALGSMHTAGQTGYLMYQEDGPFNHGGTQTQIGIVKKEGKQWYYGNNILNGWVAFNPNSAFIVGSVNGAGSDAAGITAAAMWSTGTNVEQIGGIAGIDQITGTNIATYIEDLAVDSAQIKNAAITTAKINDLAVDTLKIGDNAVTIPSHAFTAAEIIDKTGDWQEAQTITYTSSGATASVIFIGYGWGNGWADTIVGRILLDGTVQENFSLGVGCVTCSTLLVTTSGSRTISFEFKKGPNMGNYRAWIKDRSLQVLETKK